MALIYHRLSGRHDHRRSRLAIRSSVAYRAHCSLGAAAALLTTYSNPQFLNAERYRLQGIEVETALRPFDAVLARVRYSYLDAEDRTPGREGSSLQYRPRHLVSTELRYTAPSRLQASGTVRYVAGQVFETRREPLVQANLPVYALVGVRLRQPLGRLPLAVFAGADNLFDAAYEQSYGFPQAGRVVYLGVDIAGNR